MPMTTNAALHGINLLESFEAMLAALGRFTDTMRGDDALPLWVSLSEREVGEGVAMRDKAALLYQSLWYQDGQDGRETLTCPGIVGAGAATVAAAADLNAAKDGFKAAVLALKKLDRRQADGALAELHARNADVAAAMRRMGTARLNLKQAYRHIPLLPKRPLKIGFTWSKQGRTIQRTTVAEARRLLERRAGSLQVSSELEKLASVPEQEMLARVRSTSPHLRANILLQDDDESLQRSLVQAPLPIMIPLAPGEPLPSFVPIPPEPSGQVRLKRSDVRIEEEPFLPLLRIHRYQPMYR